MQCAFHPATETGLRCSKCDRPICGRCAVLTPVGSRCRECARLRRPPTYTVGPVHLLRGTGAALGGGLAVGSLLGLVQALGLVPWPLLWLYGPVGLAGAGYLVGEAVSLATNRKRAPALQALAVAGLALAYLSFELLTPGLLLQGLYPLVGLVVGAALAIGRVR